MIRELLFSFYNGRCSIYHTVSIIHPVVLKYARFFPDGKHYGLQQAVFLADTCGLLLHEGFVILSQIQDFLPEQSIHPDH